MSRWLQNVGDFLEKLDDKAGEGEVDDVAAARDLANSLRNASSFDDEVQETTPQEPPAPSQSHPTPAPLEETSERSEIPDIQTEADGDAERDGEVEDSVESEERPPQMENFQTPVSTTPNVSESSKEQYTTPSLIPVNQPSDEIDKRMLQQLQARISSLDSEKSTIQQEARSLRKHMVTLNEQLDQADREIEAQRGELEQAATTLATGREQAATKLQTVQKEHASAMAQLQQETADRLAAAAHQHQQQQDALRHELLQAHDEHQQEGGNLAQQLADAAARQAELDAATAERTAERDVAISHGETLQAQLDTLNDQLESVAEQAQTATLREQTATTQLDTMTSQHQRVLQQHRERETKLEQNVAQLSAALAHKERTAPVVQEQPRNHDDIDALEECQAQLLQEQEEASRLRAELQAVQADQSHVLQLEQEQYQTSLHDFKSQVQSLQEQLVAAQFNTQSLAVDDDDQQQARQQELQEKVEALSDQLIRQRDALSRSHGEVSALRTRLTAALNRATVAEAEASAGPAIMAPLPRRRRKEQPPKLFQDGSSLNVVDGILSSTVQVLRRHPVARWAALVYLVLLHAWTLLLLVFHAHAATSVIPVPAAHGPGALLRGGQPGGTSP